MESNVKMILIVAVTIIAALLIFNIGKLTGQVYITEGVAGYQYETKAPATMNTVVTVTPSTAKAGQVITITVNPGDEGILEEAKIYRTNGFYEKTFYLDCGGFKCKDNPSTGKTSVPFVAAGQYYVKILDIATQEYAYGYFDVVKE